MPAATRRPLQIARALNDIEVFSARVIGLPLRPYQADPARAILDSVLNQRGLTFTVMMSRQSGKNELSAHLEAFLLFRFQRVRTTIVKAAPTLIPQATTSIERLEAALDNPLCRGRWSRRIATVRFRQARVRFFSGAPGAKVVSATASLLLEIDEAQGFDEEKYLRDFRPMGASTNVTTVLYGTAWSPDSLLEHARLENRRLEAIDGIQRNFFYPWPVVAAYNPAYEAYVRGEEFRLGPEHPVFRTQYLLEPLSANGRLFSETRLLQMERPQSAQAERAAQSAQAERDIQSAQAERATQSAQAERATQSAQAETSPLALPSYVSEKSPTAFGADQAAFPLTTYPRKPILVAGIDIAGEDEAGQDEVLRSLHPRRDSTAVAIARVEWVSHLGVEEPRVEIVHFEWWTGRSHADVLDELVDLLKNVWPCQDISIDATGIGAGIATFFVRALGADVVHPFSFTAVSKSALGFQLLAAASSGRLGIPRPDPRRDDAPAVAEAWTQARLARSDLRPNQLMRWDVDPREGHDDLLVAVALAVEAAQHSRPRVAIGRRVTRY